MISLRRAILLLLGTAIWLPVGAVISATASAAEAGVVSDLTWYINEAEKQQTVAAMEDLGSTWTRLSIQWREAEPQRDQYNEWWMNEYSKAIDMAHAAGQRVVVMVDEAPEWASGSASSNSPANAGDFAQFMSTVAHRYAGRVDAWEIWNEENTTRFWSSGPSPSAYAALLRAAYPAVKAADPSATVVFGGTSGNDYTFLEGVYAAGGKGYFDVLATHPYPYCGTSDPETIRMSGNRISRDSFLGYREMHNVMVANHDEKPIWITEMGWNTSTTTCNPGAGSWQGGISETQQAEYLYKAYKLIESDPYVKVALWYNLRNNYWLHDENQAEAQYGLMTTEFHPKPAYNAFKAYAHGEPYPVAPPPSPEPKPKHHRKATQTLLRIGSAPEAPTAAVGRVLGAGGGQVTVTIQTFRRHKGWRIVSQSRATVSGRGRYRTTLRRLPRGRLRLRARFHGSSESKPSRSHFVRLATQRKATLRRASVAALSTARRL